MVSKASELFPEPLNPVITVRVLRGISTSMFFRLCCRAPCTVMRSSIGWEQNSSLASRKIARCRSLGQRQANSAPRLAPQRVLRFARLLCICTKIAPMAKSSLQKLRNSVSLKESRRRRRDGTDYCEVCRWRGPTWLGSLLKTHHVIPVRYNGDVEAPDNLTTLCPNHHALADALSHPHQDPPKTRDALFELLRSVDQELPKCKDHSK